MSDENAGLCADCTFAQVVETARGSRFYRCRRSESDERFRRYPQLPVLTCEGYERTAPGPGDQAPQS